MSKRIYFVVNRYSTCYVTQILVKRWCWEPHAITFHRIIKRLLGEYIKRFNDEREIMNIDSLNFHITPTLHSLPISASFQHWSGRQNLQSVTSKKFSISTRKEFPFHPHFVLIVNFRYFLSQNFLPSPMTIIYAVLQMFKITKKELPPPSA